MVHKVAKQKTRSLINAYNSEMWKHKFKEEEFEKAIRSESLRMKEELNKAIKDYINKY